jgi:hypothetical protein
MMSSRCLFWFLDQIKYSLPASLSEIMFKTNSFCWAALQLVAQQSLWGDIEERGVLTASYSCLVQQRRL